MALTHAQPGKVVSLLPGDWVYLDRAAPHSLSAVLDSSLLLTIHFDARGLHATRKRPII